MKSCLLPGSLILREGSERRGKAAEIALPAGKGSVRGQANSRTTPAPEARGTESPMAPNVRLDQAILPSLGVSKLALMARALWRALALMVI